MRLRDLLRRGRRRGRRDIQRDLREAKREREAVERGYHKPRDPGAMGGRDDEMGRAAFRGAAEAAQMGSPVGPVSLDPVTAPQTVHLRAAAPTDDMEALVTRGMAAEAEAGFEAGIDIEDDVALFATGAETDDAGVAELVPGGGGDDLLDIDPFDMEVEL